MTTDYDDFSETLESKFDNFEDRRRVAVTPNARELIKLLLLSYTDDPSTQWEKDAIALSYDGETYERILIEKQSQMLDSLEAYLDRLVRVFGCREKITTPDVVHWLTTHQSRTKPMPVTIPRPRR